MSAVLPWERVDGKVTGRHRDALAVVYIRQSTRQQVLEHGESTRLQYALVDRAAALGWQASRIMVIDDDLGRSGASAVARPGFQRLVSEVSLGHVGLVLGIEMSRLARSGKDFYQLLELCALSGTLLADTDGVYDPGEVNDRMLLGLKGTMSEVELHLIKQRMQAGKVSKARRGELGFALPMGYVRRPSGEAVLDPDEQVRSAVRLVFDTFAELGTLSGVLRYLVVNGIDLPMRARSGPGKGELTWRRPNRATLQWMLHSPIYAGIYAYGRRRVDPRRKVPGRPSTGKVVVGPDQWIVMIPGALPAYISEQTWRDNLARLAANASKADTPGAARRGSALLSGLVYCGRCGKRMSVRYHVREGHRQADYACARELVDYGGRLCQAMAGTGIDTHVTAHVLAALEPAAVAVSLHAVEQIEADRARVDHIWRQRIERAGIDVDRARRRYRLAEPENRLVVRQLEQEWEQALAAQQQLQEDYARFTATRPPVLTPAERAQITARAADLPALWHAETTTITDRKEIIRAVVEKVHLAIVGDSEQVTCTITWAGGHTTTGTATRAVARLEQLSYYPQLLDRVRELAEQGYRARAIVERLAAEGFRAAKGHDKISNRAVDRLLDQLGFPPRRRRRPTSPPGEAPGPNEWWLDDLATELGMPAITLRDWATKGWARGRRESRPPHRWILHADPGELAALRERRARPPGWYTRRYWQHPLAADTQDTD
ncbi:recombinase family protein [Streptomyces sp. NPDC046900]|uniref:recombinase family protein n=1 Tax=Streptomyces sp. NPDC046900 TaxID=3155473 RepID=UPI0034020EA9